MLFRSLVSHDRALLRSVCEDFWMVGRGVVGPFDGDLDDYQRYLLEESRRLREEARLAEQQQAAAASPPPAPAAAAPAPTPAPVAAAPVPTAPARDQREQRKLDAQARQQLAEKTRPLKKELEQIDKRLAALTAERTELEHRLTEPLPPADIAECGRRLKTGQDETAQLEERWLEISEALEEISAQAAG